jgi:hypothetical protein
MEEFVFLPHVAIILGLSVGEVRALRARGELGERNLVRASVPVVTREAILAYAEKNGIRLVEPSLWTDAA